MSLPTQNALLAALSTVKDPDLNQDLVSLKMIRELMVSPEGVVAFQVVLTTPACPLKAKIENDCRTAVMAVQGVKSVEIKMTSEVRARPNPSGKGLQSIEGVAHIIAVSSGKGGVGKSTVAVNLAAALALEGAKVGLMDADVYGPNIPTMMGVMDAPKIESDAQGRERFFPPSAQGVKVMSMGFLIQGDQPIVWRGPMLHSVVNQFCHQVHWGTLDYLVVDMPPGTGDVQLSLAQLVPVSGAILVSTPQEVAMQDVRKAFHMFEKVRVPVFGIVENMSYFQCDSCDKRHPIFGEGGGQALAKKFNCELLAQIPLVPAVRVGGDEGQPIVVREPGSPVALAFRELAKKVAQQISIASNQMQAPPVVQIGRF
jgi:ATP-binding protein involved in chromosome partitioning